MNRFNLTFSGEILAGHDPARVKLRFGKMFAIDDPVRLERFFSGQTIILRRNLERKAAAQYYHELQLLGVVAALVKVTTSESADAVVNAPPAPTKKAPDTSPLNKTDIEAQLKARKAESPQPAAEKKARNKAILAEQKDRKKEQAAQREAAAVEARRMALRKACAGKPNERDKKRRKLPDAGRNWKRKNVRRPRKPPGCRLNSKRKTAEAEEAARLQAELEDKTPGGRGSCPSAGRTRSHKTPGSRGSCPDKS